VPGEAEEPFRVQEELLAIRTGVRPVERPVIAEDDGIPAPLLPSGLPSA
jgi:hypothetical protein